MWGLLAWLVLLAATVVLASVAFHFDVASLPAAFQALSPTQQVAAILIALVALALTTSTLWQSWRLTSREREARAVQGGILGAKKAAALAASSQKDLSASNTFFFFFFFFSHLAQFRLPKPQNPIIYLVIEYS